jgi:hypothetical protein
VTRSSLSMNAARQHKSPLQNVSRLRQSIESFFPLVASVTQAYNKLSGLTVVKRRNLQVQEGDEDGKP